MQVTMQDMYDKYKAEMMLMHERALIAEVAQQHLEGENAELKRKLEVYETQGADVTEVQEAYLEKLKQEVPDARLE